MPVAGVEELDVLALLKESAKRAVPPLIVGVLIGWVFGRLVRLSSGPVGRTTKREGRMLRR